MVPLGRVEPGLDCHEPAATGAIRSPQRNDTSPTPRTRSGWSRWRPTPARSPNGPAWTRNMDRFLRLSTYPNHPAITTFSPEQAV